MAIFIDPETGVELNVILKRRAVLNDKEKALARRMRARGEKIQDIASMFGTNQGRIADALGIAKDGKDGQGSLF